MSEHEPTAEERARNLLKDHYFTGGSDGKLIVLLSLEAEQVVADIIRDHMITANQTIQFMDETRKAAEERSRRIAELEAELAEETARGDRLFDLDTKLEERIAELEGAAVRGKDFAMMLRDYLDDLKRMAELEALHRLTPDELKKLKENQDETRKLIAKAEKYDELEAAAQLHPVSEPPDTDKNVLIWTEQGLATGHRGQFAWWINGVGNIHESKITYWQEQPKGPEA